MPYYLSFVWAVLLILGFDRPLGAADDAAVCALAKGDDAIAACGRMIASRQIAGRELARVHANRCIAWNWMGDADRALADCSEAIRLDAKSAGAYNGRCWARNLKRQQPDEAIVDCNEAIRLDPRHAGAHNNRGNAWRAKGEQDRAIADYTEAIRLNSKYASPYGNRCAAWNSRNDPDRALPDCDEAIRLDPKYAGAYSARCWVLNTKKEYDRALQDCEAAIRLAPKLASAYANRCASWNWKGDPDRALPDCDQAIQLDAKSAPNYTTRCWTWNLKKEFARALADCDEAIRADAKYAPGYNNRGNAWRGKGDLERALADYSEAVRLNPNYAVAYHNRGIVYETLGKLEGALADFRVVRSIDPNRVGANDRVSRLEQKLATGRSREAASGGAATGETRVALVIGNGAYTKFGTLRNARSDAEKIAAALRRAGFSKVILRNDLTGTALLEELRAFANEADRADWAVVYFAGHGIEFGGTNYLIPTDARLVSDRDISFESIALDQVLLAVEGARKLRMVILDACRDNPFVQTIARANPTRSLGRGLARVEPEGATLVAYAAKAGQVALDGTGENSPFVAALIKHIETPGLEVNFLFRKVRDDVLAATERRQEPFVYGSLPAEAFYFRNP